MKAENLTTVQNKDGEILAYVGKCQNQKTQCDERLKTHCFGFKKFDKNYAYRICKGELNLGVYAGGK